MATKDFVLPVVPRWADIDLNQHMRHSAFADWAAYVRTEWLNANGLDMQRLMELKVAPVMFEDRTRYLKEIRLGERITVDLQVGGTNHDGSRWLLRHTFRRGDTVCAVHEVSGGWFDIVTRHIAPAPPGLLEACANVTHTEDYVDLDKEAS